MTTLTLDLPAEVYRRLRDGALRRGASVEALAEELLLTQLPAAPLSEREQATATLRAAGLLAEPSAEMRKLAAESTLTLEEARAILDRAGGRPLSETVLEMRGPKE
jgi:plasmid stability protein